VRFSSTVSERNTRRPWGTREARPRDLVGLRPKAACFDFFEEYSARLPKFTSEDFRVQRTFLGRGIVIIEQATRLGELLGKRFDFFAPFYKVVGAEGAPARIFAVVHD
jgi:kynurenine formamidase